MLIFIFCFHLKLFYIYITFNSFFFEDILFSRFVAVCHICLMIYKGEAFPRKTYRRFPGKNFLPNSPKNLCTYVPEQGLPGLRFGEHPAIMEVSNRKSYSEN